MTLCTDTDVGRNMAQFCPPCFSYLCSPSSLGPFVGTNFLHDEQDRDSLVSDLILMEDTEVPRHLGRELPNPTYEGDFGMSDYKLES